MRHPTITRTNVGRRCSQWRSDEDYQAGREEEAMEEFLEKRAAAKAAQEAEGVK